jgi:hypothetical protein
VANQIRLAYKGERRDSNPRPPGPLFQHGFLAWTVRIARATGRGLPHSRSGRPDGHLPPDRRGSGVRRKPTGRPGTTTRPQHRIQPSLRQVHPPRRQVLWSITLYELPSRLLADNPINRYSIGDGTRGIVYADDGSLEICLDSAQPDDATRRADWLPTPSGKPFTIIYRLYGPGPTALNGSWSLHQSPRMRRPGSTPRAESDRPAEPPPRGRRGAHRASAFGAVRRGVSRRARRMPSGEDLDHRVQAKTLSARAMRRRHRPDRKPRPATSPAAGRSRNGRLSGSCWALGAFACVSR